MDDEWTTLVQTTVVATIATVAVFGLAWGCPLVGLAAGLFGSLASATIIPLTDPGN